MTGLSSLRIQEVERIVLNVPFSEPGREWYELSVGQQSIVEVVRLTTNASDLVGFGETILYYTWGRVSDEAAQRVIGQNPADLIGDPSLGAGLEMAVYDLVARALDVPVHRLFGLPKVRDSTPLAWWSSDMPPSELVKAAEQAVAQGYLAHKLKARPWFDIRQQIDAISNATPDTYQLDVDWNELLLDASGASTVLGSLDGSDRIGIYETPIRHGHLEQWRKLKSSLRHPLADHFDSEMFPAGVVAPSGLDGYVVSLQPVSDMLRQALQVEAFGCPYFLQAPGSGLTTAFTLQLAGVLPGARWPHVTALNRLSDDLIVDPISIEDGHAKIPTGPGLGVDFDEGAISRYRMEPPYRIEYPRRIRSIVWPNGRRRQYGGVDQLWAACRNGNIPSRGDGARLEIWPEDGSRDWNQLYAKLSEVRTRPPKVAPRT